MRIAQRPVMFLADMKGHLASPKIDGNWERPCSRVRLEAGDEGGAFFRRHAGQGGPSGAQRIARLALRVRGVGGVDRGRFGDRFQAATHAALPRDDDRASRQGAQVILRDVRPVDGQGGCDLGTLGVGVLFRLGIVGRGVFGVHVVDPVDVSGSAYIAHDAEWWTELDRGMTVASFVYVPFMFHAWVVEHCIRCETIL